MRWVSLFNRERCNVPFSVSKVRINMGAAEQIGLWTIARVFGVLLYVKHEKEGV